MKIGCGARGCPLIHQLEGSMSAIVVAVSRRKSHIFGKTNVPMIRLVAGLGIQGDAHLGEKVQHVYSAKKDADARNLRQVHLIHEELFDELRVAGFDVSPGALGENVTTGGLDLLGLPTGTRLQLGNEALIEITGLRNPCRQIDAFQIGLKTAVSGRDADGRIVRKAGIMGIVIIGGLVKIGDQITVGLPTGRQSPLMPM